MVRTAVTTLLDTLKVFFVFVFCTILFYFGLQWLDHNYESFHKYDEPNDGAVKVYSPVKQKELVPDIESHRLIQFLRNGE